MHIFGLRLLTRYDKAFFLALIFALSYVDILIIFNIYGLPNLILLV